MESVRLVSVPKSAQEIHRSLRNWSRSGGGTPYINQSNLFFIKIWGMVYEGEIKTERGERMKEIYINIFYEGEMGKVLNLKIFSSLRTINQNKYN